MILESREAIESYLESCRNFEDCLLSDLRWLHYGTVFELDFDYTWAEDGSVRLQGDSPDVRTLVLRNVQELCVYNELNEYMTLHPQSLSWGMSEVSSVRILDDKALLARYQTLAIPLHHIRCRWESERRIDIVFSTLEARTWS